MKKIQINAEGKRIGRVAGEAAKSLLGKDTVSFMRNSVSDVEVHITNASKIDISEKKRASKIYKRFSGYPGGLKRETMKDVIKKRGYREIFKRAVYGMLPSNKLRDKRMKRLIIKD